MQRTTGRFCTSSWQQLLGFMLALVVASGDVLAAPVPQTNSGVQNRGPSNLGRRTSLPPRRKAELQAPPAAQNRPPEMQRPRSSNPRTGTRAGTSIAQTPDSRGGAPEFPYTVTTVNPRTPIRSMPSDDGYATALVGPKTELQVWRHDPDGWLAIRPPTGSFSLVDAKHLKATNDPDVFSVSTDRAKTWVGTQIDEDHVPISQVRLKLGERVAVISSLIIDEREGAQTWYQIEPPAGEFRWVHQDDLRAGGRNLSAPTQTNIVNRGAPPADAPMSGYMPPLAEQTAMANSQHGMSLPPLELDGPTGPDGFSSPNPATNGSDSGQWRAAQQTTPVLGYADPLAPSNDAAGFGSHPVSHASVLGENPPQAGLVQPLATQSSASSGGQVSPGAAWDAAVNRLRQDPVANAVANASQTSLGQATAPPASVGGGQTNAPTTVDPPVAGMDWNQKLAWVQTRLSQDTALPVQQWNLLPLLEQCRSLWHAAPSTAQQEAVASLGKRIEEFMLFQYTRQSSNDLSAQGSPTTNPADPWAGQRFASAGSLVGSGVSPTAVSPPSTGILQPNPPTNVAYDAVGFLKELTIARGQRSNNYVLQDNLGRSICHLSAQPGVNLNNFLDQKVGVMGIKGFNGKWSLPHVSVERIDRVP